MMWWHFWEAAWTWLLWLGVGLLVVWGTSAAVAGSPRSSSPARRQARALRRRYRRGEISRAEYRRQRRARRRLQ